MSEDRVSRALDALSREPAVSWPEPAAVRQRAVRRRRRRRIGAPTAAVAVAVAITLGVALPGSSGPATPAPRVALGQHVAAHSGVAVQLAADRTSIAKTDPSAAAAVARTEQAFTLALLQHLDASGAPGNVVLSPSSVAIALAMLQNGAAGRTLTEIAHALQSQNLSTRQQDAGWATLTAELAAAGKSAGVTLQSANSLWLQRGLQMQNPFMAAMARYFDTGVWQVDFEKDLSGATDAINSWTSTHTHGKITKLFQPGDIDRTTALVLADAVYFDAAWKYSFVPKLTAPGTFTADDGSKVTVPFMHLDLENEANVPGGLLVGGDAGYQAVQLPYKGGRFAALAIMPTRGSLTDFVAHLTATRLAAITRSLAPGPVDLRFPKFTLQQYTKLNTTLMAMGMRAAFSDFADFSALSRTSLYVQTVAHRAYLEVDERGTQAAAVTGIALAPTSAVVARPLTFDRPFLFLVRDTGTGTVLFAAEVRNPAG